MKTLFIITSLIGVIAFSSCTENIKITINSSSAKEDSILIQELITENPVFVFSTESKENKFSINEPTVVSYKSLYNPKVFSQLGILYPGKNITIEIDSKGDLRSTNLADSLLQYLFLSGNSFLSENQDEIFTSTNPLNVLNLFTQFLSERDSVLKRNENGLSSIESKILDFQNHARIYSFLFYYGRMIHNISLENSFWAFINEIDNNNQFNKSLPQNILYKYEIEYLNRYNTLDNISDFIAYIDENTTNKDLAEYLKAIYINELISNPSYWQRHNQLFNSVAMNEILKKENNNPYRDIFEVTSNNYSASQNGITAYNFSGIDLNDKSYQLSDFFGKYVMIDVWATWCGACISQKPFFTEIATKFKDTKDIQFISISVDSSIESWRNYLSKNDEPSATIELFIKNGIETDFGKKYSISFIPKYILIDKEGKIVDANIQNPSISLEKILNKELAK